MRRLYLQIYATFVAIFLIFVLLAGSAWAFLPDNIWQQRLDGVGALIGELLIPPEQTPSELHHVTPVQARRADARHVTGFYRDPAEPEALAAMVRGLLAEARYRADAGLGYPRALVVPHAAYE